MASILSLLAVEVPVRKLSFCQFFSPFVTFVLLVDLWMGKCIILPTLLRQWCRHLPTTTTVHVWFIESSTIRLRNKTEAVVRWLVSGTKAVFKICCWNERLKAMLAQPKPLPSFNRLLVLGICQRGKAWVRGIAPVRRPYEHPAKTALAYSAFESLDLLTHICQRPQTVESWSNQAVPSLSVVGKKRLSEVTTHWL